MKIKTTRFGEIEGDENLIFDFEMPILGYDNEDRFILVESKQASLFKWLQSTKTPSLAFPVTAPSFFEIDYVFELPTEAETNLGVNDADDLMVLNMASIPNNNPRKTTINLLAPIVFNVNNHKAGQVILTGTNFDITYPLFKDENEQEPEKVGV